MKEQAAMRPLRLVDVDAEIYMSDGSLYIEIVPSVPFKVVTVQVFVELLQN